MAESALGFQTVVGALRFHATECGNKPAFIFRYPKTRSRTVQTFEQIYRLGGRFASVLRPGGTAGRGQLIVNTLPNCPERVVCEAGVLMTGAASVNAQCLLADGSDLLATIRVSRAATVLVDPDAVYSPWQVLKKHIILNDDNGSVTSDELPHLQKVVFVKRSSDGKGQDFLSELEDLSDWFVADVVPDDACSVFTTSGSSGFSKLVVHTHKGMVQATCVNNPVTEGLSGEEIEFSLAPLGWLGGYVGLQLMSGMTRVLCDTRDGLPEDVIHFMLTCFEEEKVNVSFIPAPRLGPLVDRLRQRHQPKSADGRVIEKTEDRAVVPILDRVTVGGQPITKSVVQAASLVGRSVFVLYASTETFLVTSMTASDPQTYKDFDTGTLTKGAQLRVVSEQDESRELPAGQTGYILFRRSVMMKEYLHDSQLSAKAFTNDGFFRTGDIGHVDPDTGHLMVQGRGSDAIMRGPYIFYPTWLEERIRACPGVHDVMIVGVPNQSANEEICACVTVKSAEVTVEQVQEYVEEDIVVSDEDQLSPRPRHYLVFDAFPVTSTGKPHRKVVKQQATARLSISSAD